MDVFTWLKGEARRTSLDWVEVFMAVEEEVSSQTTDAFAQTLEQRTFLEYVEHLYANRRVV